MFRSLWINAGKILPTILTSYLELLEREGVHQRASQRKQTRFTNWLVATLLGTKRAQAMCSAPQLSALGLPVALRAFGFDRTAESRILDVLGRMSGDEIDSVLTQRTAYARGHRPVEEKTASLRLYCDRVFIRACDQHRELSRLLESLNGRYQLFAAEPPARG